MRLVHVLLWYGVMKEVQKQLTHIVRALPGRRALAFAPWLFLYWLGGCNAQIPGPNQAPVALAGADRATGINEPVVLDGSNSYDPDGDLLKFQWTVLGAPAQSSPQLTDETSGKARLTLVDSGTWVLALTVGDPHGASSLDFIEVRAWPCQQDADCQDGNPGFERRCASNHVCLSTPNAGDCDETNPAVHPDRPEQALLCNDGIDNDCDGLIDAQDPGCRTELAFEIENLQVVDNNTSSDADPERWEDCTICSNQAFHYWSMDKANDYCTYRIPELPAGKFEVQLNLLLKQSQGIFQLAVRENAGEFKNIGSPIDTYTSNPTMTSLAATAGTVTFTTAGPKEIRYTVTGKNPNTTSFQLRLDAIRFKPL